MTVPLPYLLDYEMAEPRRLLDQHLGLGPSPETFFGLENPPMLNFGFRSGRPWRQRAAPRRTFGSTIKEDRNVFQVNLDVQHFLPEEITVKTANGYIVVEGKHEEKKDQHGLISRHFTRRYEIPDGCVPQTVESKLSADGVLTITAPREVPPGLKGERIVPIVQTGPLRTDMNYQANCGQPDN